MGLVKLESGEVVKDRRTNGARLKLDGWDWIKIMSTIAVVIFGAGKIVSTVNANTKILEEHSKEIRKIPVLEDNIADLVDNSKYIRGRIDELVKKIR